MTQAANLTPERLFGDPPLLAAAPLKPSFLQSGAQHWLLFLRNRASEREVLELWRMDCQQPGSSPQRWLSAEDLLDLVAASSGQASEAERAERERLRLFAGGITAFLPRPEHGQVVIPLNGQALLVSLDGAPARRLTTANERHGSFQVSPKGRYLSYVRGGDLFYLDIDNGTETQLTNDASDTITNGQADFIAQEEMHRFAGHWWHPNEDALAYQRTDEAPIPVAHRHDIQASQIQVIEQRYPYTGGPNAAVSLHVYDLEQQQGRAVAYQAQADDYLARVHWLHNTLWIQSQSRDQQRLTLLQFTADVSASQPLLVEHSDTWINLHDNLFPVAEDGFCWTSERDGTSQLYVGTLAQAASGNQSTVADSAQPSLQSLTNGNGHVSQVHGYAGNALWFSGWLDNPTEQQLFRCQRTDTGWQPPEPISQASGWHECTVSKDGTAIATVHSASEQPPQLLVSLSAGKDWHTALPGVIDQDHPYHPYLAAHQTPQLGSLLGEDGTTLHYKLTRPNGASASKPVPAIVYVYGGPGPQLVKDEWPPLLLQLLCAAGYAVFQLDNRGSGNRGRAFEAGIFHAMGTVEVTDQLTGVDYLRELDWIDASRIGVFGHSYGGYMTLRCLLQAPQTFAAGVSVAPVTDWTLYDTHYTERYLGLPAEQTAGYADAAILGHCESLERPLLLMHGMADDNVLFANTTALLAELQAHQHPFELMTYPGSKHALQEPHVATHRFNLLLDFFHRHLHRE